MTIVYVVLTCLTAAAGIGTSWMNFTGHPIPVAAAEQVRVPTSWMLPLGSLQLAGALGLLAGFALPAVGIAAAAGLVLYFVGAVLAHLRVADFHLGPPLVALALTAATLGATVMVQTGGA